MSAYYPSHDDEDFIEDLVKRKEFYAENRWHLKKSKTYRNIIPRFFLDEAIKRSENLEWTNYQLFVRNLINPNTKYNRLAITWDTGLGKTAGFLFIAMEFIKQYRIQKEIGIREIGTIFVIGFSARVIKNELLKYTEFGFISNDEKARLRKLKSLATSGIRGDVDKYREFSTRIKKRFTNRKGNGFFKFYGYREFVNHILIIPPDIDLSQLSEGEIYDMISSGKIQVNKELLHQFKNSLLVCDEIHNTYNSLEKNNWGIAIQTVLDSEKSCRALFMSATLINNSPTEVIDILNLLLPREQRQNKADFFTSNETLKPGALTKIAKLVRGRISIMKDINPKYYPSMEFVGERIPGINYLKFIRCPMDDFQFRAYKEALEDKEFTLSQDSQHVIDLAIENPEDKNRPLYQTSQIKRIVTAASQTWKDKVGFDYVNGRLVGNGLKYDSLRKYSSKYTRMLDEIFRVIKEKRGKIFIFHNIVHTTGVLLIEQILLKNGFVDDTMAANDSTICMQCGQPKKSHMMLGSATQNPESSTPDPESSDADPTQNSGDTWLTPNEHNLIVSTKIPTGVYEMDEKHLMMLKKVAAHVTSRPLVIEFLSAALTPQGVLWMRENGYKLLFETKKHIYFQLNGGSGDISLVESAHAVAEATEELSAAAAEEAATAAADTGDHTHEDILALEDEPVVRHGAGRRENATVSDHVFRPARFVVAHSEVDKSRLENAIELFNAPDNADGNRIMILVGSKIIKESYDLKAIQNVFVVGRPDNIPTLIQIRGRAIRKGSHLMLPEAHRHVSILVFVASRRDKKLSTEEQKYKEKLDAFEVIQKIMQVFNQNAVDAPLNAGVFDNYIKNANDPLAPLPITFAEKRHVYTRDQLIRTTFAAYRAEDEVMLTKRIIKRIFIELASIWGLDDLREAIRNAPFELPIDPSVIDDESINIALWQLCYNVDDGYVEPLELTNTATVSNIESTAAAINRMYDSNDKIVMSPNGQKNVIVPIFEDGGAQYFVMCPIDSKNAPVIDIDSCFRLINTTKITRIDINDFVKHKRIDFDYNDKKRIFYRKFVDVSIENMENAICEYGTLFHISFLDECIEYIFRVWTDGTLEKSEMHDFYFKMLYYYDILSLVMWAYTCKPRVFKEYVKYAAPVQAKDIKLKVISRYEKRAQEIEDISPDDNSDLGSSGVINLLKTSYNRTSNVWIPQEFREEFNRILEDSLALFNGRKKRMRGITKVSAKFLPIGHYIGKFPRIYHPERGWSEDPTYVQTDERFVENDIAIGYDERSQYGTHIRFKLRKPIQSIKRYKDSRKIEKGSVCRSIAKNRLREIAKQLDVVLGDSGRTSVEELCMLVRSKLIRLELKERIKKTNVKWFYFHYEEPMPKY